METHTNNMTFDFYRNIKNYRPVIDNIIKCAESGNNHTHKPLFEDPFNYHLSELNNFIIKDKNVHKKFINHTTFNKSDYKYIESFIFHHSELVENQLPKDFDEDEILNMTDYFYERIKNFLGKDQINSDQYKYFVNTTYSILDSFYQYELMHPKSNSNPWKDLFLLCSKGYFLLCENKSDLKELISGSNALQKIVGETKVVTNDNMGVIGKGQLKSNRLTGFIMDERFSLQNILFDILSQKALGYEYALNSEKLAKLLPGNNAVTSNRRKVLKISLNSMKKAGLIGSAPRGFFAFETASDVQRTIDYHQSIMDGLYRTIKVLETRKNKF